jgi:predicted amidohydrolase
MTKLALIQMYCAKAEIAANLSTIESYVQAAAGAGDDIVVFPEMSITGYINPVRMPKAILTLDHPAVQRVAAMTAGTDLTVLAGLVEANPAGKPFITQVVAQRGAITGFYRKITIAEDEHDWFDPGDAVPIFRHGDVPFGISICADHGNAWLFGELAARGAQLVLAPSAPGLYGEQATRDWQAGFDWWRGTCARDLGGHAQRHGLWIAVATQAGRTVDEDFPGGGYVFGPDGTCIAETGDWSESVLRATVPVAHAYTLEEVYRSVPPIRGADVEAIIERAKEERAETYRRKHPDC